MSIVAENRGQLLDTLPPLIRQMTSQEMWDTDETGLSLPNIFGRGSQVTGFLDLGHCGIADPYQDLALCFRSLKHNLEGNYGGPIRSNGNPRLLFEKLGIEPDWEKIRYYILLDELF